jgi:hypothetical protein
MTALGWTLLAALYFIGFTHGVVMLRANIIAAHRSFTWGMVNRTQYAWPISMLSETWNMVRG